MFRRGAEGTSRQDARETPTVGATGVDVVLGIHRRAREPPCFGEGRCRRRAADKRAFRLARASRARPDTEADDARVLHAIGRIERDRGGNTAQGEVAPSDRHLVKARAGSRRPAWQPDLGQQLTYPECGAESRDEEILGADVALTRGAPQREPGS